MTVLTYEQAQPVLRDEMGSRITTNAEEPPAFTDSSFRLRASVLQKTIGEHRALCCIKPDPSTPGLYSRLRYRKTE